MSDIHAIRRDLVSITPLQSDTTHQGALAVLRGWEATLTDPKP